MPLFTSSILLLLSRRTISGLSRRPGHAVRHRLSCARQSAGFAGSGEQRCPPDIRKHVSSPRCPAWGAGRFAAGDYGIRKAGAPSRERVRRHRRQITPCESPRRATPSRRVERYARQLIELHQIEIRRERQHDATADDQEILGMEVAQDVAGRGAERAADADLPASLADPEAAQPDDAAPPWPATAIRRRCSSASPRYGRPHTRARV